MTQGANYYIHAVLFSTEAEMKELWIRSGMDGFFRFHDEEREQFVQIYVADEKYMAVCEKTAFFQNSPLEQSRKAFLIDGNLLTIIYEKKTYHLYAEKRYRHQMKYVNFGVLPSTEIRIGSFSDSDIYYDSPYISGIHASINCSGKRFVLQCFDHMHGIFVNDMPCCKAMLKIGDVVSIMGLSLIIGPSIISIRDNPGVISVNPRFVNNHLQFGEPYQKEQDMYFNRLPRKRNELPQLTVSVEGPPMSMDEKAMPIMLKMGSAMVMGGSAALAGHFTSLISSVMFPFLTTKYSDKQKQNYERLRKEKYRAYLDRKEEELLKACKSEKKALMLKYPDFQDTIEIVSKRVHLWERRPQDSDFLY